MEAPEVFFVIIRKSDTRLVRHKSFLEAENEARVLVLKERDKFYIMKAVVTAELEKAPVVFKDIKVE